MKMKRKEEGKELLFFLENIYVYKKNMKSQHT